MLRIMLFVSGPEAVNAAVEVLLNLGSTNSCIRMRRPPSVDIYRASNAIGDSPRSMNQPQRANNKGQYILIQLL